MLRQRNQLILILFALSAVLHGYKLSEPRYVVFDEVHFGGFINDYHDGRLFFDIHPPHAKLLIAGAAIAGGYRGDQDFKKLGTPITKVSPGLLRFVPALAGTLIPLVLFGFLIQLGASPMAAITSATSPLTRSDRGKWLSVSPRTMAASDFLRRSSTGRYETIFRVYRRRMRPLTRLPK